MKHVLTFSYLIPSSNINILAVIADLKPPLRTLLPPSDAPISMRLQITSKIWTIPPWAMCNQSKKISSKIVQLIYLSWTWSHWSDSKITFTFFC